MGQTAQSLQGKEESYGKVLTKKKVFIEVVPYALSFAAPAWVIYRHWWMALIVGVIFFFIGCSIIIQPNEEINYHRDALQQRHAFIEDMTMTLSEKSQTPINALNEAQKGLSGEFRTEIAKLEDIIHNSQPTSEAPKRAFQAIMDHYHEDTYFCQYMQEIEHAFQEGNVDRETCDDISKYHNVLFGIEKEYGQKRAQYTWAFCILVFGVTALLYLSTRIINQSAWLNLFAYKPIGLLVGTIYLIVQAVAWGLIEKYNHDDTLFKL